MNRIARSGLLVITFAAMIPGSLRAEVKPHALFTEGAVLQQRAKIPVWGTATDGEKVTVEFRGQRVAATAKGGEWKVELKPQRPGGPFKMVFRGDNVVTLTNVFVGEVWICSGQSNMEWPLAQVEGGQGAIANANDTQLRLFRVPHHATDKPRRDMQSAWKATNPENVAGFSAVGYFFGRDLRRALKVPVGLIQTTWGGTTAEAWTRRDALEADPSLRGMVESYDAQVKSYPDRLAQYQKDEPELKTKHAAEVEKARAEGKPIPRGPTPPVDPAAWPHSPATLYNGMIAPLVPYAFRGAIWYQGESNAGRAWQYRSLLPAMIENWRASWNQSGKPPGPERNFPFYIVQLAPYMAIKTEPAESTWAELREAQLLTSLNVTNAGLVVILDLGDERDIHPRKKEPVGGRLALMARARVYGERLSCEGPLLDQMTIEGNRAVLTFKGTKSGLSFIGELPLKGFTIAGEDRKWHNAQAEFDDLKRKVIIWSPNVEKPAAVRYGWADYPVGNLCNREGFLASPFRTDDWPLTTQPK